MMMVTRTMMINHTSMKRIAIAIMSMMITSIEIISTLIIMNIQISINRIS